MNAAAKPNTSRHPTKADSAPPTTRPINSPIMMPETTVPTARPRSNGAAMIAANGTICCGTQLTKPRPSEANSSTGRLGASAAREANSAAPAICASTMRLRS